MNEKTLLQLLEPFAFLFLGVEFVVVIFSALILVLIGGN